MILREILESLAEGSSTVEEHRANLERYARLSRLREGEEPELQRLLAALDRERGAVEAAATRFRLSKGGRADWAFATEAAMDQLRLGRKDEAEDSLRETAAPADLKCWTLIAQVQAARLGWNFGKVEEVLRDARASSRGKAEVEALFAMERAVADAFSHRRSWTLANAWNELGEVLPSAFGLELFVLAILATGEIDALQRVPDDTAKLTVRRELLLCYEVSRGDRRAVVEAAQVFADEGAARSLLVEALAQLSAATAAAPTATLALALQELARRIAERLGFTEALPGFVEFHGPWRRALQSLPFAASPAFAVPSKFPQRTVRLSWLASRVAGSLIKQRVLKGVASKGRLPDLQRREQARLVQLLTRHLGELKGPFMKLGQQISGPILESLPPDVAADLQRLYEQSPTMGMERVTAILEAELGTPVATLFQRVGARPIGAGSVGQVHAATLRDGTEVAVKVQFDGIADAIRVDMGHLRRATPLLRRIFPRANVEELIAEWATMLESECDYRRERDSMRQFAALWRGFENLVLPKTYDTHSGGRVITMEKLTGQRLGDFAATASQAERNRAARTILRSSWHAIVRGGVFNVDPHPGNYVFFDGRIGCLDFGRVKRWTPEFVKDWTGLIVAAVRDDFTAFRQIQARLGFAGDKSFDFKLAFETFKRTEAAPFVDDHFVFRAGFVRDSFRAGVIANDNLLHYRVPRGYLMATRMHWGLFHVLEILRADGNWWEAVEDLMTGVPDSPGSTGT